jgi:hypothetical protein
MVFLAIYLDEASSAIKSLTLFPENKKYSWNKIGISGK